MIGARNLDPHRLHSIAAHHGVTAVVRCGAVSGPMAMIDHPYGIILPKVVGTANIIELARVRGDAAGPDRCMARHEAGRNSAPPTALLLASDAGSFYVGQTLSPNGGDILI